MSNINDLDAILINYEGGQDAPHVVPSIINHNAEEKTFDVQVSITNGHGKDQYDSYLITGNLQFTFKSTTVLEKSQDLHLEITETVNVIEPNEGLITTVQLINGTNDYNFTFAADLQTTGMYDFRAGLDKASLNITHDFACPKGMSVELKPDGVSERSKNIKIKGTLHFDNEALRLSDYDLHSTLVYRYTNSKSIFTDVYGEKSFILKIVAQKGIYAPDMSVQPNHIKLMPNDDFTGSTAGNKIRFTGFGFSGYPNLDNVALEGTGDFANLPSENIRFEIDRDSVDPGLRKFDIVGTFDNLSATE
ncbi:MAG: hypothetical protein MJ219_02590 [Mycoplasmoidaceae bacterium]|nr:hypothetical protein [Mycoplasmoidaceae bacterium]